MTQLLISVTNIEEARLALDNHVDILDFKDPAQGALGALPISTLSELVNYVNRQKLTSATIGDLAMTPKLLIEKVRLVAATGVDYVKIGFFPTDHYQPSLEACKTLKRENIQLVAVLFVEYHYPQDLVECLSEAGFAGVMLDTAIKNSKTFMDYQSESAYSNLSEQVRENGMFFGLAGSLRLENVAEAKKYRPAYLGFRGGLCIQHQRQLSLCADKVQAIRKAL